MRFAASIVLILAISACGQAGPELDDPAGFDGVPRCGAEDFQYLLGKRESALEGVDLPEPFRVLHPGDVITLDFSPDRMTIDVDSLGLISSITCR